MMKSKGFTYFLGFAVVLIWGMIFYKLYKAMAGDDEPVLVINHVELKDTLTDYAVPKDTVHLLLNYRDPFSPPKAEPVEIPVSELVHKTNLPKVQKLAVNWSVIRYSGFIRNQGSKKLIAMVNVNGKELMLSEGETAEQVKLIKNLRDSIKVSYQGVTKFIVLNNKSL